MSTTLTQKILGSKSAKRRARREKAADRAATQAQREQIEAVLCAMKDKTALCPTTTPCVSLSLPNVTVVTSTVPVLPSSPLPPLESIEPTEDVFPQEVPSVFDHVESHDVQSWFEDSEIISNPFPMEMASPPLAPAPPILPNSFMESISVPSTPIPTVPAVAEVIEKKTKPKVIIEEEKLSPEEILKREKVYAAAMKPLQFSEVDKFEPPHVHKQSTNNTPTKEWAKRVGGEYKELSENLPLVRDSGIFVRIHETDMQYAQFMITGPVGTPYARGCYKFDIYFPPSYPSTPPKVQLTTTGQGTVRFNPNLYDSGYVCLSLLGTWSGDRPEQNWQPDKSTLLQVMVSIQSLVMGVEHPYYNEPGYGGHGEGGITGEHCASALSYTRNIEYENIRWGIIDAIKNPPSGYKEVVHKHFYLQKDDVIKQAKRWQMEENTQITDELIAELEKELANLKEPSD